MDWLTYLQTVFSSNLLLWKQDGIDAVISQPSANNDNNSVRVDFDTNDDVGRITMWESGECDTEILNVASEDRGAWKHYQFKTEEEAGKALTEFIQSLLLSHSSSST